MKVPDQFRIELNPDVPSNSIYLIPPLPEAVLRELESLEEWVRRCCGVIQNVTTPPEIR